MPFKKGHQKYGGRKKGILNKRSKDVRDTIETHLGKSLVESLLDDLEQIQEPAQRAAIKSQLMRFAYPMLKALEVVQVNPMEDMSTVEKIAHLKEAVAFLEEEVKKEDEQRLLGSSDESCSSDKTS